MEERRVIQRLKFHDARMHFDGSLKIWSLTCDPRPMIMVRPLLSENDEYRPETLPSFINRHIRSGMLVLEDAVLRRDAFGNEIV